MYRVRPSFSIVLAAGMALAASASVSRGQQETDRGASVPAETVASWPLPDAPTPQIEMAAAADPLPAGEAEQVSSSDSSTGTPGDGAVQGSSQSSAQPVPATAQHDEAASEIKQQEKQRVAGVLPSFNVSYRSDAASMTAGQKISLAFRSSTDWFPFGLAFIVGGLKEADNDSGFGWGPGGYFKRTGAAYLDSFDGNMIGNGFLPALLHQDPRYFRLGHGTFPHRFFYAVATSYICKHDNSHRWEPNYSNVGGNIIAGAISNLYYPSQNSGWGQTISNGMIVTVEGTFGGVLNEFWPDISRKFLHKDPTHGLDAEATAADKKKQAAGNAAHSTPQP